MNWEVIFRPESLAMYGEGILTTLGLLASSLAVGGVRSEEHTSELQSQ